MKSNKAAVAGKLVMCMHLHNMCTRSQAMTCDMLSISNVKYFAA